MDWQGNGRSERGNYNLHAAWELRIGTHCDGTTGEPWGGFDRDNGADLSLVLFSSDMESFFVLTPWQ
jgi:hypothetical protein